MYKLIINVILLFMLIGFNLVTASDSYAAENGGWYYVSLEIFKGENVEDSSDKIHLFSDVFYSEGEPVDAVEKFIGQLSKFSGYSLHEIYESEAYASKQDALDEWAISLMVDRERKVFRPEGHPFTYDTNSKKEIASSDNPEKFAGNWITKWEKAIDHEGNSVNMSKVVISFDPKDKSVYQSFWNTKESKW